MIGPLYNDAAVFYIGCDREREREGDSDGVTVLPSLSCAQCSEVACKNKKIYSLGAGNE